MREAGHHGPNEDTPECKLVRLSAQQWKLAVARTQYRKARFWSEYGRLEKLESLFERA